MKENNFSSAIINKGRHLPAGNIITIEEADRGLACNCICVGCTEKLIAAKGEKNIDCFKHASETDCKGGQETALHQMAKEILIANTTIQNPGKGEIDYYDAVQETSLSSIRPDVSAKYQARQIYFEVAVKHFIEADKNACLINGNHRSIEIDLSSYVHTASRTEIEKAILKQTDNKRIIYWDSPLSAEIKLLEVGLSKKDWAFIGLAVAAGFYAIRSTLHWLSGRRRKK